MDVDQEIIPHCNSKQVALDFADQLPSYYRFCFTDSELILDCLNAKIESREPPKCRLHEVNIYNHKPEELAEQYRSHENKWYFLTSRDGKYPKGNRPDRAVLENVGYWKTTQVHKPVYDATSRQIVGHKGTLTYYENRRKTMWLMHEYTANGPNLPFENGDKLNKWVLCKIYKEEKTTNNHHRAEEVGNNIRNPKEVIMEEPIILLSKRRRVSENNETNFSNHHPEQVHVQMVAPTRGQLTIPVESAHTWVKEGVASGYSNGRLMNTNPYPINPMQPMITFQDSNLIQPALYYDQNQITSNACNGFQHSDGASSSCSIDQPPVAAAQPLDYGCYTAVNYDVLRQHVQYDVLQQHVQNSYQDPKTQLNVQTGSKHYMVDVPHDAADCNVDETCYLEHFLCNLKL